MPVSDGCGWVVSVPVEVGIPVQYSGVPVLAPQPTASGKVSGISAPAPQIRDGILIQKPLHTRRDGNHFDLHCIGTRRNRSLRGAILTYGMTLLAERISLAV